MTQENQSCDNAEVAVAGQECDGKKKHGGRNLLKAVIFVLLALALFVYFNLAIGFNGGGQGKGSYATFDTLQENTVDAVIIGSSASSRYFVAPKAYNDEGIASYVIGAPSTPTVFSDNIMRYVKQTQNPKVFVVELRNALRGYEVTNETRVRLSTDSIGLTQKERYTMIDEALDIMNTHEVEGDNDTNFIDYVFPIIKYHSRATSGSASDHITVDQLLLKPPYNTMMGFWATSTTLTQVPQKVPTWYSESAELSDDVKEMLDGIIDYCDETNTQVLFTISPCVQTQEQQEMSHAVEDYVDSRGYTCLNFNTAEMIEACGIDYSTDFYNSHHTNYLGAEAYTEYLAKYLKEHYDLPDHRGDSTYAAWDKAYGKYQKYVSKGITDVETSDVPDEE